MHPLICPASTISVDTFLSPSVVIKIIGGTANIIVATAPAVGPTLKKMTAGSKYVKKGSVWSTLKMGRIDLSKVRNFQAVMPKPKPIRTASGAASVNTDIVCIAIFHWPISAVHTNVVKARSASLSPPK